MPFITVGRENTGAIHVHYEDHGTGPPAVLVHGYLLDGHSWEKQETALLAAGYRVITYDRRGFGASSQPSTGYDFQTLSADLRKLLHRLSLHDVVLVGFGMGTGEVTRYLAANDCAHIRAAALLSPLPPFLLHTADNPQGLDRSLFEECMAAVTADRPAAAKAYLDRFYNIDTLGGSRVSDQSWQNSFHVALRASATAARDCIAACLEDFRPDLPKITIPVLVIQGSQDRILPPQATGDRLAMLLGNVRHVVIEGGPNAIIWTHGDQVNRALLDFIRQQRPHSHPDNARQNEERTMAFEQVLDVVLHRHVFDSERPFSSVLDGIFRGISRPEIGPLFSKLAASTSYEQFSALVQQAQGSAGLMRFLQLDLDNALALDPQAPDWAGRRLVRLIAGNPVTMAEMTRHVPDAGSYAPVTILIQQMPDGRTRVAYDTVASAIAPYHDAAASEVAQRLDTEVLDLLRQVTGMPATATA